jgi:hypothetical protein
MSEYVGKLVEGDIGGYLAGDYPWRWEGGDAVMLGVGWGCLLNCTAVLGNMPVW